MELDKKIISIFSHEANSIRVKCVTISLGYTSVLLEDGRCGLCCTLLDQMGSCNVNKERKEYEGEVAINLLNGLKVDTRLSRVLAIATVNALNQPFVATCPIDSGDLMSDLHIPNGGSVAMVGHFDPVVAYFNRNGVEVKCYDKGKSIGNENEFYDWSKNEADALVLTATSVINGTCEEVLSRLGNRNIPTVLMGPSTIMRPEVFAHLPITMLAGINPIDICGVQRVIRNAKGTRDILKYSHKVKLMI